MSRPGELAIVLHTHMPYVEGGGEWPPRDYASFLRDPDGFGTWPFGEEWLWEAVATSYVPLLSVLGQAPLTLSLTPVLCDQLEAPGAMERCIGFLEEVRPESHARDKAAFERAGEPAFAAELDRSASEYAAAARRLRDLPGGLLPALGEHASWTSTATHAVLPLLVSDTAIALQLQTGIASHRRRFGAWGGGLWLPECAYAPWLDRMLEEAGVRHGCIELTNLWGTGDERHLRPIATDEGFVLWPVDRQVMSLVWSDRGYPSHAAYRNYHGLTPHHHRVWRNDGAPYDYAAACSVALEHARDFVGRVQARVAEGGICVCALDTELLGHWWYEGVLWLRAVIDEASRQGLALTALDDALARLDPLPAPPHLGVSSWGEGGDLRTWSAPAVADFAWMARSAEVKLLGRGTTPNDRALRELLALQSSDWPFLAFRQLAGAYPLERARGHADALAAAVAAPPGARPALRNLAPELRGWS